MKLKHQGLSANRLNDDNPREVAFSHLWQKENDLHHLLEYLLSEDPNRRCQLNQRDVVVAATTIQWLGSNCGMAFLRDVIEASPEIQVWFKPTT